MAKNSRKRYDVEILQLILSTSSVATANRSVQLCANVPRHDAKDSLLLWLGLGALAEQKIRRR